MVRQISSFSTIDSLFNQIFHSYFYKWPTETKPPMEVFPIVDYGDEDPEKFRDREVADIKGLEIQMALAGFTKDDVDVFVDDDYLTIKGDNSKKDNIANRFKCNFNHKIPYSKQLDVKKTTVSLENGILSIQIPTKAPEETKFRLFGGNKKS